MEAGVFISEGEPARVYFVFQTGEGQRKAEEVVRTAERF